MTSPKILIIETATPFCNVGLGVGDELISSIIVEEKNKHDELLATNIKTILQENNLSVNELDAIAINAGPGSFTGLRVGVSLAKSLSFDGNPKIISMNTLELISNKAKSLSNNDFDVLLNSHSKIFYRLSQDGIIDLYEHNDEQYPKKVAGIVPKLFQDQIEVIPNTDTIDLKIALNIALKKFHISEFENSTTFEPRYH